MFISGVGLVYSKGRGISILTSDLEDGPKVPEFVTVPLVDGLLAVFQISPEFLTDPLLPRSMRRADRFSRIVTLAALDAIEQSGRPLPDPSRTGILFATSLGPHVTTFEFLEEILAYGDAGSSPTVFAHSVHNAAVSYVCQALQITGPASTITQFKNPFGQVLLLAKAWLANDRCDQVLVGAGDEFGSVLAYILSRKLPISTTGQIRPFLGHDYVPGEGAVFFLLSRSPQTDCALEIELETWTVKSDLHLVDAEQMPEDTQNDALAMCYVSAFGHTFSGTAFHAAIAAAMIQEQRVYQGARFGSPAMQDHQIAVRPLNTIACRRYPQQADQQIIVRKQR